MAKIESPNNKEVTQTESNFVSKISGFSQRIFGMSKFILGICLLPFVYAVSAAFLTQFSLIEKTLQRYFWAGVISMLITYLFIWEPAIVYARGQKLVEIIFNFLKPLVRIAPYVLPVYTIVIFFVFLIIANLFELTNYFIFLFGLTIALHLIFSARSLRSKKEDFLKGNYIFGFSLIYIINLTLLSFCFSVIFEKFSFVNFCNYSFQIAKSIFGAVVKQLFL
jgi:hypothetical protein